MIGWLTNLLYYPIAKFQNSSLSILDGIVQFYLLAGIASGLIAWWLYYWVANTEFFGKVGWWVLFGVIASTIVIFCIQYEITSKINAGALTYDAPAPDNLRLLASNFFFFAFTFCIYFIMSAFPALRGHRLKRIPFTLK